MKRIIIPVIAVLVMPGAAAAESVRHVPLAEAEPDTALELVAIAPATIPTLALHYRTAGTTAFAALELVRRDDQRWVAVVPADAVEAPGLEYYLDAGGAPVFASAAAPHRTRVAVAAAEARRARDEARTKHRRWGVYTSFEWVDYGQRESRVFDAPGTVLDDHYYRIDAAFSYRLWAYPLEVIRFGYTRLIGQSETPEDTAVMECEGPPPCNEQAGFKVAGWFELGLAPIEGVGIDARAMALASQSGFSVGGRAELRIGVRDATHVASGVEYMADVGVAGFFRFGWGTVPRTPMSATVEITQLPASNNEAGVRLYYDVAHQIHDAVRIGVRLGYAARDQELGGITGGANASLDF